MKENNKSLIVIIVILSILVAGLGGYIVYDKVLTKEEVKEQNNESTNNKDNEETNNVINQLLDDKKIEINNKINQFNQSTFADALYWIPNNIEEKFNTPESKLLFLSNMVVTYGDIVTDTETNKSYYKLDSIQEKSKEYFGEELNLSNTTLEYNADSKYSNYIYIDRGNHVMKAMNPVFKSEKISYDKNNDTYTLYINILDEIIDPEKEDTVYNNDYLDYDEELVVATGEIKYKKNKQTDNYNLVSFKYINK